MFFNLPFSLVFQFRKLAFLFDLVLIFSFLHYLALFIMDFLSFISLTDDLVMCFVA